MSGVIARIDGIGKGFSSNKKNSENCGHYHCKKLWMSLSLKIVDVLVFEPAIAISIKARIERICYPRLM